MGAVWQAGSGPLSVLSMLVRHTALPSLHRLQKTMGAHICAAPSAELNGRSLAGEDFVAVWTDAAYVANTQFVFCIGATAERCMRMPGFAASSLEDAVALGGLPRQLVTQWFRTARGVLCCASRPVPVACA